LDHSADLQRTRGKLPHWFVAEKSYFVTICCSRSVAFHAEPVSPLDEAGFGPWFNSFRLADRALALSAEGQVLSNQQVARFVTDNLNWLRNRGWILWAFCIMPNHVHLLMRNAEGRNDQLEADLGQYKNFTAREVNKMLGRSGPFWQRESFDHWCRSPEYWLQFLIYTVQNPVEAGLCSHWREWPWSGVHPEAGKILEQMGL
jgi:putative transposase